MSYAKFYKKILSFADELGWTIKEIRNGVTLYPTAVVTTKSKRIYHLAIAEGWKVRELNNEMVRVVPSPVTIHKTPSDHRAIRNLKSELNKRGMRIRI